MIVAAAYLRSSKDRSDISLSAQLRELTKLASEMRGPERDLGRGDPPILTLKSVAPTSAA